MIAIHTRGGSFSSGWVSYCKENDIPYREVDCFASDIIERVRGCRALLWHWEHNDHRASLFARQLTSSLEEMGILVFPNTATSWHYDDKVGQKYLLEAIRAPLVPSHVFYDEQAAMKWADQADFPKVWKLRGGAGSQNVRLVHNKEDAQRIIKRSFRRGWSNSRFHALQDRFWHFRRDKSLNAFLNISRGIGRAIIPHEKNRRSPIQKGYVYFQDFIPDNGFDIRIVVIGGRAFGLKRMAREGDFRASGSGYIVYNTDQIPIECVRESFKAASSIRSQSCAFDFVKSHDRWMIIEISYAFSNQAYYKCEGIWTQSLEFQPIQVAPERYMIEDLLQELQSGHRF